MRKFERLSNIFFGVELFNGEIDLSKHRERIIFFIVEHTTNKGYIEKQAMQLLVAGCRDFHFFGAEEPLWHLTFDEVDVMMCLFIITPPCLEYLLNTIGNDVQKSLFCFVERAPL